MTAVKNLAKAFMDMPLKKKIALIALLVMTLALIGLVPVYAWFTNQKKAAEMYKVEYPNSLYINAAHREDQINFDLGEINMNEYRQNYLGQWLDSNGDLTTKDNAGKIVNKRYVFSVSGSNTEHYKLQLAHTTNNEFTYTIYKASQYYYTKGTEATEENGIDENDIVPSGTLDDNIIPYKLNPDDHTENPLTVVGDDVIGGEPDGVTTLYYVKGDQITLAVRNDTNTDGHGDINTADTKYYKKDYGTNDNVQANAVPIYAQAACTTSPDSNKKFCDYYILEITWPNRSSTVKSKETDLVYLSVERTD